MAYKNAHAARIEDGIVREVIVIPYLDDDDAKITAYCNRIGLPGTWVDTSYAGSRRGKYAGVGDEFREEARSGEGEFVSPSAEPEPKPEVPESGLTLQYDSNISKSNPGGFREYEWYSQVNRVDADGAEIVVPEKQSITLTEIGEEIRYGRVMAINEYDAYVKVTGMGWHSYGAEHEKGEISVTFAPNRPWPAEGLSLNVIKAGYYPINPGDISTLSNDRIQLHHLDASGYPIPMFIEGQRMAITIDGVDHEFTLTRGPFNTSSKPVMYVYADPQPPIVEGQTVTWKPVST